MKMTKEKKKERAAIKKALIKQMIKEGDGEATMKLRLILNWIFGEIDNE